jgi:hypothetical protein
VEFLSTEISLAQALSFYKIFGYPTGLGALLVRRASMPLLAGKLYFGGGTVAVSCADVDVYKCGQLTSCNRARVRVWIRVMVRARTAQTLISKLVHRTHSLCPLP